MSRLSLLEREDVSGREIGERLEAEEFQEAGRGHIRDIGATVTGSLDFHQLQSQELTQDAWCRRIDPGHVAASEARRDALLAG